MHSIARSLAQYRFILASKSPRRKELLRDCVNKLCVQVIPSDFVEDLDKSSFASPELYAMETAKEKAKRVFESVKGSEKECFVVACDTIVVGGDQILEKPKNVDHARQMLQMLSDTTHCVCSGVAIYTTKRGMHAPHLFFEKTYVTFGVLEEQDIESYIATGEPMDKAGAYGIQGIARCFVKRIDGCLSNVIGFPIQRFFTEIQQLLV